MSICNCSQLKRHYLWWHFFVVSERKFQSEILSASWKIHLILYMLKHGKSLKFQSVFLFFLWNDFLTICGDDMFSVLDNNVSYFCEFFSNICGYMGSRILLLETIFKRLSPRLWGLLVMVWLWNFKVKLKAVKSFDCQCSQCCKKKNLKEFTANPRFNYFHK